MVREIKKHQPSNVFYQGYLAALYWVLTEHPFMKGNNHAQATISTTNGEVRHQGVPDNPEDNQPSNGE